jgi:diaminohydroxyphosphoribosylaminopyrimidine deaminase/5-amino-6-(5-phosphoribosylamino)uracil reductase
VLADDCALTVRRDELGLPPAEAALATARRPLRVVLDSSLRTPPDARVLAGDAPVLLCHGESVAVPAALARTAAEFAPLAAGADGGGLDLEQLMAALAARQCNEILVESGPRLAGALLQRGLLDAVIVYLAPALLGSAARPLLELPLKRMADKIPLQIEDVRKVGQDWRFTVRPG